MNRNALLLGGLGVLSAPLLGGCTATAPSAQVPTFAASALSLRPGPGTDAPRTLDLTLTVSNPNPFPVRLHNFRTTLYLMGEATADVPLPEITVPAGGHATQAAQATLPAQAAALRRIGAGQPVAYRLDGTFAADLGALGQPTFGPLTLAQGLWAPTATP